MTELLKTLQTQMEQTPQEPAWHGEGSVWNHTRLVCEVMQTLPEYRSADAVTQKLLYLAAVFHDVGKIHATRQEDGRWVSPGHARISAQMTRQLLWQDYGLCGTPEKQGLREAVCGLIRYHTLPVHAFDEPDGRLRLLRFAANGALAPGITVKNLCLLAKADLLGRICQDQQEQLEKLALCEELAKEAGCWDR